MAFSQLDEERAFLKAMLESLTAADLMAFSIVADAGEEAAALNHGASQYDDPMTARRIIEAYSDCRVDYASNEAVDSAIEKYLP